MAYRDVAMDLVPDATGKYRGDRPDRTAPKDWYVTYAQSQLRSRLADTTGKVARLPKLRNFRGGRA